MNLLRLKVVLAAIDYDDASQIVLAAAQTLADAAGAALHVVHVEPSREVTEIPAEKRGGTSIDMAVARIAEANVTLDRAKIHVIAGDPAHVIRVLADRIRADVIVLGPHRADPARARQMGSTALSIATESWAPCLVVTRGVRLPLANVLVPVDLSDTARGALMVALSWASALRGEAALARDAKGTGATTLTALYVDRSASGATGELEAELDRIRREAGSWAGVAITGVTTPSDDIASAIADRARDERADLIVLGTRGLGLDAVGRLGSVSEAVTRRVDVPVLLVPPAVWTELREEWPR
jgi:nucleotide-binding universal stress UspA family protein